ADARARARGARDIDLKGAAAYPGFIDSHAHLMGIGMRELTLNLDQVRSVSELQAALRTYAAAHPEGPIFGRGWIETHWPEGRFPTRQDLDAVVSNRPVFLERSDGHASVANSAGLALGGVTRDTRPPFGGDILKDQAGEPNGMLIDAAQALVGQKMPEPSAAMLAEAVQRGSTLYASRGWTGMGNMSVGAADLANQQALAAKGQLPIRVDNYLDIESAKTAADRVLDQGPYADASGLVRVMGVKMYMDGALGSRGAALLAPYSDAPDKTGLLQMTQQEAAPVYARALKSGAQVATHAIGDRGNRMLLDWYQAAFAKAPGAKPRWRDEHTQIVSPADLGRFVTLGIVASMQPSHAIGDFYFAPARLGEARLVGAYSWKTLLKSGAVIAAGTDAPVEVGSPLIEFYAAVARKDLKGFSAPNWHSEEAVTRAEALRMITWAGAYAAMDEKNRGTLEVGKKADITVFSKDLMTVPEPEILTAKTVYTIVNGKVVYEGR
ncbi:MAG: amidohydrolase, partial [Caulobacteraceae bacterium]